MSLRWIPTPFVVVVPFAGKARTTRPGLRLVTRLPASRSPRPPPMAGHLPRSPVHLVLSDPALLAGVRAETGGLDVA
jgi:hypothetical protein